MIWSVALGGALGSVARFLLGAAVQQRAGTTFPIGTLLINISGALVLGFLMRFALSTPGITPTARVFLTTGFCGGYTTFSTFSYETFTLLEDHQLGRAALYVILSVTLALIATYLGVLAASQLIAMRDAAATAGG
jgi:CrcB protein